jgi:hypothetical protein
MSNADKLIAVGAQVVGGDMIWKHKVLGHFRNGDFSITEEGQKVLAQDIEEAEVKETKPKSRKAKATEPTDDLNLDDILGAE